MKQTKLRIRSFGILTFLLISLIILLSTSKKIQNLLTRALFQKADLVINVQAIRGDLPQPWRALAQGGEEKENLLTPVVNEVADLKPAYIRIDHIFDFYELVKKENNQLIFDFRKLDLVVDDILKMGAKPFFSLSYMPAVIASGDLVSAPQQWQDWQVVIRQTINHYSGYQERNLKDIYYEVWNEPDLFGKWKLKGDKDYLNLYYYAATAAAETKNVNPFKLGGPATTSLYPNWIRLLIKFCQEKNLKLDFISWHTFNADPEKFNLDLQQAISTIQKSAGNNYLEKIITEWGSDSEINPQHDSLFDAAHEIAVLRNLLGNIKYAFSFEIKDGLSPAGEKYWGRWGLLTNQATGITPKPRYFSHLLLTKLSGQWLQLNGENEFIKGIASSDKDKISLILVNFDQKQEHQEIFPVTFQNLINGDYRIDKTGLDNQTLIKEVKVENNLYQEQIFLKPNEVLLITLEKISPSG